MYKTSAEVETTQGNLIEVEMNAGKDNVDIYVRNTVNCKIHREATIDLSTSAFIGLILPILKAAGYIILPTPEEI